MAEKREKKREFSLDALRTDGWFERIVNPGGYSDQEVKEGYAKVGTSPLGQGVLTILDSKTSPVKHTVEGANLGRSIGSNSK